MMHILYMCLGRSKGFFAWTSGTLRQLMQTIRIDDVLGFPLIPVFCWKAYMKNIWFKFIARISIICFCRVCVCIYIIAIPITILKVSQFALTVYYQNLLKNVRTFKCHLAICCEWVPWWKPVWMWAGMENWNTYLTFC